METTFSHHDTCPKCGSSDNLAIYSDGSAYCYTPGCDYVVSNKDVGNVSTGLQLPEYLPERSIRSLSTKTLRHYSVGISKDKGSLIFPYYKEGVLVAYKELLKDKKNGKKQMFFTGKPNDILFGTQTTNTNRRYLIITEGCIDALSAYEMTGYCAVSVPTGAGGALKSIKHNLKFIEQFSRVFICFDNDEAGQRATDEVMEFLKAGSTYRVLLTQHKDANDYLQANHTREFNDAIKNASQKPIETLYTREELKGLFDGLVNGTNSINSGLCTGFEELDKVFRLREEEVTTIFADPAVGKSSFCRQIMSNLIRQKVNVLLVAYEESDTTYIDKTLNMFYGCQMDTERYKLYYDDIMENFFPYIHVAKVSGCTLEQIEECIEHAVRVCDVKVVVFDNVTACTAGEADMHNKIGQFYMTFNKLGKLYKHHTLVVSHTKRDSNLKSEQGEIPYMRQGYGSGGIERYSYNVIALGRAHDSDVTGVAIRKNRTTGELAEFEVTWNSSTKSFNEVTSDVRPKIIPYPSEPSDREGLGLEVRTGSSQEPTKEHTTDTVEVKTRDICCDHQTELQPGLHDTVSEGEPIRRNEREAGLPESRDYAEFDGGGKKQYDIDCSGLFPFIPRCE